jgi:hypothetical protein
MTDETAIVPVGSVEGSLLLVRGQRVILDADLAKLYGVTTTRLNEQVKRNAGRFPSDFMFQLSSAEKQEVVAICDNLSKLRYYRGLPYAFTEHGAIMAASVLNSERAVAVSVFVVRAFVKLREMLSTHKQLAVKLDELEARLQKHDGQIAALFEAIRELMEPPPAPPRERIGFDAERAALESNPKARKN